MTPENVISILSQRDPRRARPILGGTDAAQPTAARKQKPGRDKLDRVTAELRRLEGPPPSPPSAA